MPRLIIVAGASGAGKTFMLSQLSKYRNDIIAIKKFTTRGPRKGEPTIETIDLHLCRTYDEVKECEYTYPYNGNFYGIKKCNINKVLMENKNPIVVVANCNTISKIKKDFPSALVFYVNSGLSGNDLKEQLLKYRDPVDVDERMKRQKAGFNDYVRHLNKKLFDYVLINYFDETFIEQIECILEDEFAVPNDINHIFVIMSFDSKYNEIYEAIKLGGKLLPMSNLRIQRVSEQKGDYVITDTIERSIITAELIICDVSEKSLNVYYELGYARAQNKYIILTAMEGTVLPFDVQQYKVNFYKNEIELQKIIEKELLHYYNL